MVFSLADIDADEHIDVIVSDDARSHPHSFRPNRLRRPEPVAASLGIHVTNGSQPRLGPVPISDHTPPTGSGDNTPQIMNSDRGQRSCRTQQANTHQDHSKGRHEQSNGRGEVLDERLD